MGKLTIMIRPTSLDDQPALRHRPSPRPSPRWCCGCSIPTGPCSSAGPSSAALAIAAVCGVAVLWITNARSPAALGARQPPQADPDFDVILGLALTIPSLVELKAIVPENLAVLGL